MYCIDSVHSLIEKSGSGNAGFSLKYILAILNSKLGAYMYALLICETGKVFAQVKLTFLRRFPVKSASPSTQARFSRLVEKILRVKQVEASADVSVLECEIDEMVYALYSLTPEEIKLVEGAR